MESNEIYIQDYRHFDSLIWQVPAWASVIFSFSITASVLALGNAQSIERALPISAAQFVAVLLFSIFIVFLLLTSVFLRFRLHQRSIHRPNRRHVPNKWYLLPGQTSLLLILFIESSVILTFAVVASGIDVSYGIVIGSVFLILGFTYVEKSVRNLSTLIKSQREPSLIEKIG